MNFYFRWLTLSLLLSLFLFWSAFTTNRKCSEHLALPPNDSVMYWLEGTWIGEGYSYNRYIHDSLVWKWSDDHHQLNMNIISTQGDSFKAEGYLSFLEEYNQYQLTELSNVSSTRKFKGNFNNNELLLYEMPPDKDMVLSLKFSNRNEFLLEEYSYGREDRLVHVSERFKRKQ